MRHSTGKPTKAEAERMERLKRMWRCIACERNGYVEIHHLLSGNKRRGHMFTIPLCRWCHRGQSTPFSTETVKGLEANVGPSLARTSKKFHERYGTDDELLERTNQLLKEGEIK